MGELTRTTPLAVRRSIRQSVQEALSGHGFRYEAARQAFVRDRAVDLRDRISLPTDFHVDRNVVVGTVNLAVHCIADAGASTGSGGTHQRPRWKTLTWNIGYLMPQRQWMEWEFPLDEDIHPRAAQLVATIVEVALPWLDQVDPLESGAGDRPRSVPPGFASLRRAGLRRGGTAGSRNTATEVA